MTVTLTLVLCLYSDSRLFWAQSVEHCLESSFTCHVLSDMSLSRCQERFKFGWSSPSSPWMVWLEGAVCAQSETERPSRSQPQAQTPGSCPESARRRLKGRVCTQAPLSSDTSRKGSLELSKPPSGSVLQDQKDSQNSQFPLITGKGYR